ncbi:MAG: precorrin-6y C5,15-methyltransferase (decarboxylating) subunit CbiE [Mariprofundaceae bacterium]|nr:precorrin-6y C5,15-methyltransferase (decarboxylating) subunit CbiE [Mariprofundaceae bacterium]
MNQIIHIIGVLDNGTSSLNPQQLQTLKQADVVISGTRLLDLCRQDISHAQCFDFTGQLKLVSQWIKEAYEQQKQVVILASGDPLCHGIASYLTKKLPQLNIRVLPNLSNMQLACARLTLAWQDLHICSIHKADHGDWFWGASPKHSLYELAYALQHHTKIGVFTSPENNPKRIVELLKSMGMAQDWSFSITEDLMSEHEKVTASLNHSEVCTQIFSDTNIVILQRIKAQEPIIFGNHDDQFIQRKPDKGLITKYEVRAVSLAHLQLHADSIVWDIGAGSGSVGLEAARLCRHGHVYAIEKNKADFDIASQNQQRMHAINYSLTQGKAPEGLEQWPDPSAIFIGGSGGELATLIALCLNRLQSHGKLVMNFVTLENMNTAINTLKELQVTWHMSQLQIACSQPILHMNRLQALNPVWVITAEKTYLEKE